MARQRQAVRTDRRKQQISWLRKIMSLIKVRQFVYLMLLLACVTGMLAVYKEFNTTDILPIETVEIEGEFKFLMPEDLKQHALPEVKGGFFSVRLEGIRDALLQLPWVEDVSIHRQWPQALRIRVMEKQPVAFWGEKGLVSSRGELFEPEYVNRDLELPMLIGLEGQYGFMLKQLGKVQVLLAELDMNVVSMKQDSRRSWTLILSTGFELRLGRSDMYERLQRFVDVYEQHMRKQEINIKHVDMRYTNGFAVAYKEQVTQGRGV